MNYKLIWVGPKESDILYSNLEFFRSVTFNGSNSGTNIAFTSKVNTRIDHISDGEKWHLNSFLRQSLHPFLDDPDVRFLFYNPAQGLNLGKEIASRILCANRPDVLTFFRSKANMREFAGKYIPIVPYVHFIGCNFPNVKFDIANTNSYILQIIHSSSGAGTYQFSFEECNDFISHRPENEEYIVSPYLKYAIPINVHIVVFACKCIVFPSSVQLIDHQDQSFCYLGGDYHTELSQEQYNLILSRAEAIGEAMRVSGYRGVCGVDFLLTETELYFLEINPRFQASSFLCNKLLMKEGKPSLHILNLMAFLDNEPPIESFSTFQNCESFFTLYGDWFPSWLESKEKDVFNVFKPIKDGLSPVMELTPNAYLCRIVTSEKLYWITPEYKLNLAPNIQRDAVDWRNKIRTMNPLALKIGLLNQGVRFTQEASQEMARLGSIRAGVFQSVDLTLSNKMIINSPYHTKFSDLSPYCIELRNSKFFLSYEGELLDSVTVPIEDPYRENIASNGTYYRHAVFLATDRLRVHHELHCHFKEEGCGCRFCNVKMKTGNFSIQDVCEIVDFYLTHMEFNHFLIGGGSGNITDEYNNILTLVYHIRSRTDMPIYVMSLPPTDISILSKYHRAGVNEIGFNLELFNRTFAIQVMPGKGQIPLLQYETAYKEAVRLWGNHGAVRSLMVLGLEPINDFYQGINWLCSLGVMPIISVFRPMKNIELNRVLPPANTDLEKIFWRSTEIAAKYGLALGPTCIACQNNTLSLSL